MSYPKAPTEQDLQRANDRILERQRELEAEREAELARNRELNAESRRRYEAKLDAEREKKAAEDRAAIDAALAPALERAQREWLIGHPGQTKADFEAVRAHVRAQLLEDQREATIRQTQDQLAARYGGRM